MLINKKGKENRGENGLGLLNRRQFLFGFFFNKLNTNNLMAIVNIDPKNTAGFRGI